MKIRKATIGDISDIDRIYMEGSIDALKLEHPKNWKKYTKDLKKNKKIRIKEFKEDIKKDKKSYYIVVEEDDKIIGFGLAYIKSKEKGKIELVYVDKNFRRRKIGIKIVKRLVSWLKSRKIKKIESEIHLGNIPSIKLKEKVIKEVR